jgi:hypothetical protein
VAALLLGDELLGVLLIEGLQPLEVGVRHGLAGRRVLVLQIGVLDLVENVAVAEIEAGRGLIRLHGGLILRQCVERVAAQLVQLGVVGVVLEVGVGGGERLLRLTQLHEAQDVEPLAGEPCGIELHVEAEAALRFGPIGTTDGVDVDAAPQAPRLGVVAVLLKRPVDALAGARPDPALEHLGVAGHVLQQEPADLRAGVVAVGVAVE